MINFIKCWWAGHRWGNSNRLTRKHRTAYSRCRGCGATKRG